MHHMQESQYARTQRIRMMQRRAAFWLCYIAVMVSALALIGMANNWLGQIPGFPLETPEFYPLPFKHSDKSIDNALWQFEVLVPENPLENYHGQQHQQPAESLPSPLESEPPYAL